MLLKIAWRNMLRYRKKSLAAFLSIIMAFISLSLFEGYMHDVKNLYEETFSQRQMLGDVIIERSNAPNPGRGGLDEESLNADEQAWIESYLSRHAKEVKARVRFLNVSGFIQSGSAHSIFVGLAYDVAEGEKVRGPEYQLNTFAGKALTPADASSKLLLGRGLADILDCSFEGDGRLADDPKQRKERPFHCKDPNFQMQVNTEGSQANAMDLEAAGLISTGFADLDAYLVMFSLESAHRLYNTKRVSYISVALQNRRNVHGWISDFNEAAKQSGQNFTAMRWQDHSFGDMFRQSIDFLNVFRNFVISIVLAIVTMAVINTFVKMVHERLSEIGTLRSIGFQPAHVLQIFSMEALLLAFFGSIFGIASALLLAEVCNRMALVYKAGFLSEGVLFSIQLHRGDFVWITALICTLTLLSTFMVAWRATKQRVSELMIDR